MILENGVIRTMDASVPVQRALAIAGERVAGGIGTHETALASPDVVDLGGRCVLPGFTDAHVHFPSWALALRQVRLEGTTLARRGARPRPGRRRRRAASSAASAGATRSGPRRRRRRRSTPSRATFPPRSSPTTTTRSGSTRPRSHSPAATSRSTAAWSSGTAAASRRASSARSRPGSSGTSISPFPTTSTWTRCARGCAWPPPAA